MTGIVNLDKPRGLTSRQAVGALSHIFGVRGAGHGGTLDPMATGVLPVMLGRATRLCDMLHELPKTYVARFRLGVTTDSQDATGRPIAVTGVDVGELAVREALTRFAGEIEQMPPMYSAVRVDGMRLYDAARAGRVVERTPRRVTVYDIELRSFADGQGELLVRCGKGTYIRSICAGLGDALGCGAVMTALRRTGAGGLPIDAAHTLDGLRTLAAEGRLYEALIPPEAPLLHLPRIEPDAFYTRLLKCGCSVEQRKLGAALPDGALCLLYEGGAFRALCRACEGDGGVSAVNVAAGFWED